MRCRSILWLPALAVALAGCSGARASTSIAPDTAAAPPTSMGSVNRATGYGCNATVTGVVTGTIATSDGPATAGSDYWLSADERSAAGSLGQVIVTCTDRLGMISLASAAGTTNAQVPFGPGRYALGTTAPSSPILVVAVLANRPFTPRTGTLEIDRFDNSVLTGTFDLELIASNNSARVHAHGRFTLSCQGLTQCRK